MKIHALFQENFDKLKKQNYHSAKILSSVSSANYSAIKTITKA